MLRYALSRSRVATKPLFMGNIWKNGYRDENTIIRTINKFHFCTATGFGQPAVTSVKPIEKKLRHSQGGEGNFNAASFDILVKSSAFVDRTLLIERLIYSDNGRYIITAPLGFGKSAMLSMVKLFIEHYGAWTPFEFAPKSINPNFKLFTHLKIAGNTELMEKHFGRYPVIHLDLTCHKEIRSYKDAIDMMRDIIHGAYKNHRYLLQKLPLDTRHCSNGLLEKWIDKVEYNNTPVKEVLNGLSQLAEMLHIQHDQKCYILVDDYDSMINSAVGTIEKTELYRISNMVLSTLGGLFKGSWSDQHIAGGIITGVNRLSGYGRVFNTISPKSFPKVHEFSDFLGLNEKEVCTLFEKHGMDKFIDDALYHYNSHVGNDGVALYNPWSVFSCIHNKKECFDINEISDDWKEKDIVTNIIPILKIDSLRSKIYTLLAGESISVTLLETLSTNNLEELNIFMSGNKDNLKLSEPTVFSFLVRKGFLKIDKILNPRQNTYLVSMPNLESKNAFRNALASYFKLTYSNRLSTCQRDLNRMLGQLNASNDTIDGKCKSFLHSFYDLLDGIFQRDFPNFREIHLKIALEIIFCLIYRPPNLCPRVKIIDDIGRQTHTKPDIYLICEDLDACIIGDIKMNVPLNEMTEQMTKGQHMKMIIQSGALDKNIKHCLVFAITCTARFIGGIYDGFDELHMVYEVRGVPKEFRYCNNPELNQLDKQEKIRVGNVIQNTLTVDANKMKLIHI